MIKSSRPISYLAFSEWLDCFRWVSAWVVMVSHVGGILLIPLSRLPDQYHSVPQYIYSFIAGFSHHAVMIFFVMSGYLVGGSYIGSADGKKQAISQYVQKRLSRLLTVLVPALVMTALLSSVIYIFWGSEALSGFGYRNGLLSPSVAFCNVVFMQDVFCRQYGNNLSLWSLTHEFWYYICFPMIASVFLSPKSPWSVVLFLSAAAWIVLLSILQFHPVSIGLYFLVWLLGVLIAVAKPKEAFAKIPVAGALGIMIAGLTGFRMLKVVAPELVSHQFSVDVIIALAFCFVLIVLKSKSNLVRPPLGGIHHHLAKFSFSLYCLHIPVALTFAAVGVNVWGVPAGPAAVDSVRWIYVFGGIALCLVSSYILYALTEKHTDTVRRFLFRSGHKRGSSAPTLGGAP